MMPEDRTMTRGRVGPTGGWHEPRCFYVAQRDEAMPAVDDQVLCTYRVDVNEVARIVVE